MMTPTANASIVHEGTTAHPPMTPGEREFTPLTEAELDCVVGAGRKPGVSSGTGV